MKHRLNTIKTLFIILFLFPNLTLFAQIPDKYNIILDFLVAPTNLVYQFSEKTNYIIFNKLDAKKIQIDDNLTKEEYIKAEEFDGYYRVPADNRDLNYGKYFEDGSQALTEQQEYNSHNTKILTIPEIKEKLLELEFVRNELESWNS